MALGIKTKGSGQATQPQPSDNDAAMALAIKTKVSGQATQKQPSILHRRIPAIHTLLGGRASPAVGWTQCPAGAGLSRTAWCRAGNTPGM
jgi:hypothetical protein